MLLHTVSNQELKLGNFGNETTVYVCMFISSRYFLLECGGKMHLREGEFSKAHTDFFEAFKNYDESGSPR